MKNVLVVLAAIVAGCSAQKPADKAPASNVVTLATFTGEVDTVKGTFTVQMDPASPALGEARYLVIPEGAGTVTIANTGAVVGTDVWNNAPSPTGACGGANVTGARVIVTQKYPSPTFLGSVYAEITSVSATGMSACNSTVAPSGYGVSATYGLWSHGSLAWGAVGGATASATTEWNFLTSISATRFAFSGRIAALMGTEFTGFGADSGSFGNLQDTGTRMVYAPNALNLQFIKYDGTTDGTSAALPAGYARSLDVDSNRIWFATSSIPTYVGYMNADGTGASSYAQVDAASVNLFRIRIDPADSTRAFFIQASGTPYLKTVSVGTPPTIATVAFLTNSPSDFAFGANGNIFITSGIGNVIWEYTKAGSLVNTYSTAGGSCQGPYSLTQTSDGTFWFTADTSSNVCTLVPTGPNAATVTARAACSFTRNVVQDESGNVWAACRTTKTLLRFTPGSSALLTVAVPAAGSLRQVATSSGLVWSQAGSSIYRAAY